MIRLDITCSLQHYHQQILEFAVNCDSDQEQHIFHLEALGNCPGVVVQDLQIVDANGLPVAFTVDGLKLQHINAPRFRITYRIQTRYTQCVGFDREFILTYPFISATEAFFGTGVFAHPDDLPQQTDNIQATFQLRDLPAGWGIFTNLPMGTISPGQLDEYYVYCAVNLQPAQHTYAGRVSLQFLAQDGVAFPVLPNDIWRFVDAWLDWLETHLAPYWQQPNILFLRAADDFRQQTDNRAGATGENVLNGIVSYGPSDPDYLEMMFGYRDYSFFVYDGLAHEFMHAYTTTSWTGRYKAILYPSPDCPPPHSQLIGEGLNLYFHRRFLYRYLDGTDARFYIDTMARSLNRLQQRSSHRAILNLLILDAFLHDQGSSLLTLYQAAVVQKSQRRGPYDSAEFLFELMARHLHIDVPSNLRQQILGPDMPDYATLLPSALNRFGYSLLDGVNGYKIQPIA